MAGFSFRCQEAGVRGRERVFDLDDEAEIEGPEGKEGLRQGSKKPWKEPDPHRLDDPRRGHGRVHVRERAARTLRCSRLMWRSPWRRAFVEGQVVVLDNLGAHRTSRVTRTHRRARGCELVFLPSYSPDLNPIEEAFSKIKNIVRKAGERTRERRSTQAIAEALEAVTLAVTWWDGSRTAAATSRGVNTHELRCQKPSEKGVWGGCSVE